MRRLRLNLVYLATLVVATLAAGVARAQVVLNDATYNAHHPRLLFTNGELSSLRAKVQDGGRDDDAYAVIRYWVQDVYPTQSMSYLLGQWFGLQSVPAMALVGHIESPNDQAALALGKTFTTHIATTYNADFNESDSSMRLRSLALGYDAFFANATEAERGAIRDEIVLYIQKMVWNDGYRVFEMRPYLANHSAMVASALGLAAIALQGEADPALLASALAMCDRIVNNLIEYQFDPDGAYNEGALYGLWTLMHLVYYFDARERFDGTDFSTNVRLRRAEQWLAYELLPEGSARAHNLNDSGYLSLPFARTPTYFSWAMQEWNSGLSSWLWEHSAGTYGVDMGVETDKVGTVLWHKSLAPVQPDAVLPPHRIWQQRGLYHFRTGWQTGASSNDVVFGFYSGKFQGGHAQEDQNQFSLTAYGERFVVDHGPGSTAKQSEAHNLILIDGQGQHNAGSSIGTDGRIASSVLGDFADFLLGDASQAYTTYSEFNATGVPLPGSNWSWGYHGANPVLRAERRVLVVHGDGAPPYFVIMDDIDKDGGVHSYEWRMHTANSNAVGTATHPMTVTGASASMDIHLLHPAPALVSVATQPFNNGNTDPDATVLRVTRTAVNPMFSFLLIPRAPETPAPVVTTQSYPWGYATDVAWGGGVVDHVLRNDSGATATHNGIKSDALVTLVREINGGVHGYLAVGVSSLMIGAIDYVTIGGGRVVCEMSETKIHLDRADAHFRFFDTGITEVLHNEDAVGFVVQSGYVFPESATPVGDVPPAPVTLAVSAHPNPFNPSTAIRVEGTHGARTRVEVYDVTGRRVRLLADAPLGAGVATLRWNGRNDAGEPVASGTYFLRASTSAGARTLKLTLLK